jgi:hypothetical protein
MVNRLFQLLADGFKGEENLNKLRNQYEKSVKTNVHLEKIAYEDQLLAVEEEELEKELKEFKNKLSNDVTEHHTIQISVKNIKAEMNSLNQITQNSEKELNLREKEYEQQKLTCKDLDKVAAKHTQKFQELETLQSNYNDIDAECDQVQKKLITKTQEVKRLIHCGKDIIDKIRLASSLTVEELPEISLVDFHKSNGIINKYKVRNL